MILGFDATPVSAHSDKELAAGHYKGGFGANPLLVSCGREVLAAILRPGNAGADNADDHLQVFELALEQLPAEALDGPILARSDSAGAGHALAESRRETDVRFSFGYAIDERVRAAILALPEAAWRPAINGDNQPREGAWVAELTGHVSLDAWPQGSRLIVRRERPHPGAQLTTARSHAPSSCPSRRSQANRPREAQDRRHAHSLLRADGRRASRPTARRATGGVPDLQRGLRCDGGDRLVRGELCTEAIRLGSLL